MQKDPKAIVKILNEKMGRMDENLFEIMGIGENFFGEYVISLKVNRMVKATYLQLKKIAEITGAKDIMIERTDGDNLLEIKLLISKV